MRPVQKLAAIVNCKICHGGSVWLIANNVTTCSTGTVLSSLGCRCFVLLTTDVLVISQSSQTVRKSNAVDLLGPSVLCTRTFVVTTQSQIR